MQTLSSAWNMYANDNQGFLVPNPDGGDSGTVASKPSWAAGSLSFVGYSDNTNTDFLMNPQNGINNNYGGLLGPYLQSAIVFKCPEDESTVRIGGTKYSRVRSVSLNGYLSGIQRLNGNQHNTYANNSFQIFMSKSDFFSVNPSTIFQFIEEAPGSINNGSFSVDMLKLMDPSGTLTPSTFYMKDVPAAYHENRGAMSFVDGHAEMWIWNHSAPVVRPSSVIDAYVWTNNEDVGKLALATTRRK